MIAVDSSVVVAAFASWHEAHDAARRCLDRGPALPAHAALESYSVLTRLPAPFEARGSVVAEFLASWFDAPYLELGSQRWATFVVDLARADIVGGSVYDALIAMTASAHGARLATLDRRAALIYQRLGTVVEYLA